MAASHRSTSCLNLLTPWESAPETTPISLDLYVQPDERAATPHSRALSALPCCSQVGNTHLTKNTPSPAAHSARGLSPLEHRDPADLSRSTLRPPRAPRICTYNRTTGSQHLRTHDSVSALPSPDQLGNTHPLPASHPSPESKTARDQPTPEQRLGRVCSCRS